MFKKRNSETPFSSLEKTGKKGKYFEVKQSENPDLIVKEMKAKWGRFEQKGVHPLNDIERLQADLDFLRNNFESYIPETSAVIGKNEDGKEVIYLIQHRIEGKGINDVQEKDRVINELKAFFEKVIQAMIKNLYYYGNEKWPRVTFPDLKGWNFIYGRDAKTRESDARLYFIDTYPVEGSDLEDFFARYFDLLKGTFKGVYWPVIDEFREKAKIEILNYIKSNKHQIRRVESTS